MLYLTWFLFFSYYFHSSFLQILFHQGKYQIRWRWKTYELFKLKLNHCPRKLKAWHFYFYHLEELSFLSLEAYKSFVYKFSLWNQRKRYETSFHKVQYLDLKCIFWRSRFRFALNSWKVLQRPLIHHTMGSSRAGRTLFDFR